jgi:uncharacterized protein YheU (UPF0270 family)
MTEGTDTGRVEVSIHAKKIALFVAKKSLSTALN